MVLEPHVARCDHAVTVASIRLVFLLTSVGALLFGTACNHEPDENYGGPMSSFVVRRFNGPGPIAQSLDIGGRAFLFLELTDPETGEPKAIDDAWVFNITVRAPDGSILETNDDLPVPSAWANDSGVRLLTGFKARAKGNHLVEITSPNCPPRSAPILILPVN